MNPQNDPSCTGVVQVGNRRLTGKSEGHHEVWVFEKNGKFYRQEHWGYEHATRIRLLALRTPGVLLRRLRKNNTILSSQLPPNLRVWRFRFI